MPASWENHCRGQMDEVVVLCIDLVVVLRVDRAVVLRIDQGVGLRIMHTDQEHFWIWT